MKYSKSRLVIRTLCLWTMLSSAFLLLAEVPALTEPLKISRQTAGNVPTTVISGVLNGTGSISYEWEGANSTLESGIAVATNDWKTAAAGARHVLAIKADGSLWGWGDNSDGQLGVSSEGASASFRSSPVLISAVTVQNPAQWVQVFAYEAKSGGIKSDGSLWLWGMGIGSEPVQVGGGQVWESGAMNSSIAMVISRTGELCSLDLGSIANPSFQSIGGDAAWAAVSVQGDDACAIQRDRSLWRVQLSGGVGFQKVGGNQRWKSVDLGGGDSWNDRYYVALREDGTLWAAPLDHQRILYHPVFKTDKGYRSIEKDSLLQLGNSNAWVHAVAGVSPLAVDASGKTFWVSENTTRAVDGPKVPCVRVFTAKPLQAPAYYTSQSGLALGRDSTLWAWGDNSSGQLGNFQVSSPAEGYTQDRAQVGVSPLWNLLSPVLGIPVAYSNPTADFANDIYSLKVGGQRVGRIAQNKWSTTEDATSMIRPISSGSLTFTESPMNLGAGSSTSYRWLRNGTFHSAGSSITTNAPGIYWAESFTSLETRTASGASGTNRITVPSTSNLFIGMAVEGNGIPAGTVITGFVGTGTVTLSVSLTSAIASTTSLKFGIVSKGEPKIIPNSEKALKDIYSYLTAAASDSRWEYQTLSSGSLAAGTSAAAAGSVKGTASLLKAAVDLLLLAADSTQEVKLDLVQGGTTATFRQLIGPSPKSAKLTAIGTSFAVGDEVTPDITFYSEWGMSIPNVPPGTKIVAISGNTIRLSNPAYVGGGSSTVWISSSPARKVLRSLGVSGGLDPRPGSVAADQDNSLLPKAMDTSLVKKWLMDLNPSLADKSLLGQLKNADTLLAGITDPAFLAVLPQSIFVGSNFTSDIVVDYGDVLFLRAWVKGAMAALRWIDLQNTDVDIIALKNLISTGALSLQAIWEKYSLLGGAGTGKALDFETELKAALTLYQQYSKFTNPRFGEPGAARMIPGKLCLSSLEPEDEVQLRGIVDKTLESINAANAVAGIRTFNLEDAESLTLSPNAFFKRTANRADFPNFVGNAYVPGSLKTDFAYSVYPVLKTSDIAGIERWLMGLESTLNTKWKTGANSTLNLTIGTASASNEGWITASGTISGAAPVGSVLVSAGSTASGTFSTMAVVTERARVLSSDPRIYDWSAQLPAPLASGAAKLVVSVSSSSDATAVKPAERTVLVGGGTTMPAIIPAGSIAFAAVPGQPAAFATVFPGAGALSYEWVKSGTSASSASGVAAAVDDWAAVSVGQSHTAAIKRDGSLWTWGSNMHGQLGISLPYESLNTQNFPARVGTDADWVAVACSAEKTVALKRDGTLWQTGAADNNPFREAKVGLMSKRTVDSAASLPGDLPSETPVFVNFSVDAAQFDAVVAVARDGALWHAQTASLNRIGSDTDWVVSAAGPANFAIKKDGSLWGWVNGVSALGVWENGGVPVRFGHDFDWMDVKVSTSTDNPDPNGGRYAVALKRDGSLWAWGALPWKNQNFWPGSQSVEVIAPQRIGPPAVSWAEFFPGPDMLLAVTSGGAVFEFKSDETRPVPVALPTPAVGGSAGKATNAIVAQDGVIWMWGQNGSGQIGNYAAVSSGIADAEYPSPSAWVSSPVQAGVNSAWGIASPVRGIPVPLSLSAVSADDIGSYQVRVSRGSDAFSWRTLAGANQGGNVDGPGSEAAFSSPAGLALFGGTLFVADSYNNSIRSVKVSSGAVTTLNLSWDASLGYPTALACSGGSLYVVDGSNAIQRVNLKSLKVSTVIDASSLDSTTDAKRPFSSLRGIAVDSAGTVYVADSSTIRRIAAGGSAAVVIAGSYDTSGFMDGSGANALFNQPADLALFGGTLFVADNDAIRKVVLPSTGVLTPDRVTVSTVAGRLPSTDPWMDYMIGSRDGIGNDARFSGPTSLAIDSSGTLYVSEAMKNIVRRMTPDLRVTTIGGIAGQSFYGSNDEHTVGGFGMPMGLAVDGGTLYVADQSNNWIRAGTAPSTSVQRASAFVSLINLDMRKIGLAPISVSGASRLSLSAGTNTPQQGVTYQWMRNGSAMTGANSLNATVASPVSGWYSLVAKLGASSVLSSPIPVSVDNANVTRARAAMAQGNFATASGALSATSADGTELILRSAMDLYGFLNEPATKAALGSLGLTTSGTLANGWIDPWYLRIEGGIESLIRSAQTAVVRAVLTGSAANTLFAKLEAADAKVAKITDKSFVSVLSPADFGKPVEGASNIVIDYGDVQLARALLHAGMAAIKWVEMQNTDVDLFSLLFSSKNGRLSLESLFARYPSLFAASSTGSTAQTAFESRIKDALKYYQAFSDFVNPSTGKPARMSPDDCVVKIETPEELVEERIFRNSVNKALESINAMSEAAARRTFDLGNGRSVTLSPRAFVKHAAGWRADLPRFQKNRYVPNSLNLAMLRSMYPSLTYGEVAAIESSEWMSEPFWNDLLGTREDDVAPTLALAASLGAGVKTTDGFVELSGTVQDASGVQNVRVTLDSTGETFDALLEELAPSASGQRQYNWSLMLPLLTLSGGSVKFSVTAEDVFGGKMDTPVARSVVVLRMIQVSKAIQGNGSITLNPVPDENGLLLAGTSVFVTATPAPGSLLRRIESVVNGEAQPNQTVKTATGGNLRFTLTDPTDLVAVFEVNPYPLIGGRNKMVGGILRPRAWSDFNGGPADENFKTWAELAFGCEPLMYVQCKVTDQGSFSGKLIVGRLVSPFTGSFDEDGWGSVNNSTGQPLRYSVLSWNDNTSIARPRLSPASAVMSLWIDSSDDGSPVIYARVGGCSAQLMPLASTDYNGAAAMTGGFGDAYASDPTDGDGSPRHGGFVSILPRKSGVYSLTGVLPSGEKITLAGYLSDRNSLDPNNFSNLEDEDDLSKIEFLTPCGIYGSTAMSVTLRVQAAPPRASAAAGWARRENWLSLTRGPKFAPKSDDPMNLNAFAANWRVGAVGFIPATAGRVVAPFAKSAAPSLSEVLAVNLASNDGNPSSAFFVVADTRGRVLISGKPSAGFTNPLILLNPATGVFTGSVREAGKLIQLQGVLLQDLQSVGLQLVDPYPYAKGLGYASDGRLVFFGEKENSISTPGGFALVSGGAMPASSEFVGNVSTFYIGKTEVTWGEWQTVRTWAVANGYTDLAGVGQGVGDSYPVSNVNWYDVVKWCNARSEKEGRTPVYRVGTAVYRTGESAPEEVSSANGYRLPSEREWEFAARGGTQTNGYTYSGSNNLNAVGWYDENSSNGVKEVGKKQANELGIFDMSGNLFEWSGSWYSESEGSFRVIRGGYWFSNAENCTVALRNSLNPGNRYNINGFRVALSSVP